MAETKKEALVAFDAFIETWGVIIPPQYPVYQNHLGRDFYIVGQEILHLLVEGHVKRFFPAKFSSITLYQGFDKDAYGITY